MDDLFFPRLLLIAGNGRESGKTTLACRLINRLSVSVPLVAIKISPHKHKENNGFALFEEHNRSSAKDSARMLAAGAQRSFYITAADAELEQVVPLLTDLSAKYFIVCESGGLRGIMEPGLFVIVNAIHREFIKETLQPFIAFSHLWMSFNGTHFIPGENTIYTDNDQWRVRK